ncbi:hypothetical protein ACFIJ5_18820 (plasmid) [Haloimpatiens sp. FM7330]|uniref:hypothetical protein n=1 Tax=Haloimpatiens sp. FM7330 TaxID=3298610 RepID=UPI003642C902
MNDMEKLLSPEGFNELYQYLKKTKSDEKPKTASDIQKSLKGDYKFSSGKITGIIKRAEEKGMIKKVKRGMYMLNTSYINKEKSDKINVITEINSEISIAIEKIQNIVAKEMSSIDSDTFVIIKNKIDKLQEIINDKIIK